MDMTSLYANIPNHGATEAVKEKLNARSGKPTATKIIIKFLFLIYCLGNFIFNSIIYLQIKRFAMGAICASSCASIYMEDFESTHICPYRNKAIIYLQCIEDLFFILKGIEEEQQLFMEDVRKKSPLPLSSILSTQK